MALLDMPRSLPRKFRTFFHRNGVDASTADIGAQAEGLVRSVAEHEPHDDATATRASTSVVEPKLTVGSRSRSMAELQRSYDQVMQLVGRIGDHLDAQSERQERMDALMQRLPSLLESLPEMCRQNDQLVRLLDKHLEQTGRREQMVNESIDSLGDAAREQAETLGAVREQLAVNDRTAQTTAATLSDFRAALTDIGATNHRATDVLTGLAEAAERRESTLEASLARTQKWMIAAIACCGVAVIAALAIAIM